MRKNGRKNWPGGRRKAPNLLREAKGYVRLPNGQIVKE